MATAYKRRQYWIIPDFQFRVIRHWILLVLLTNIGTYLLTMLWVHYRAGKIPGEYLYIPEKMSAGPLIANPVSIRPQDLVLPPLLIALGIGLGLSLVTGVFYSHRLAGPIYRIRKTLREAYEGKRVPPIVLRKNDEFKELAEDLNLLLEKR